MDIVFKNSKLAKEFADQKTLTLNRGDRQAKLIMRRLSEISAADSLDVLRQIPGARCHELTGDLQGQLSVDLLHPYRLIFVPANEPCPRLPEGGLDWKNVTSVRILGVQDTH